jgi:PAS domain S-box-containing protein
MISVLYVDDEPSLLKIAKLFLEAEGEFKVGISTSAQAVLDSPSVHLYDAIISDYQMPEVDGIAFLKAVRARFGDVPFILFTGRGREEVVIDAINNGADFYLQKSGDPTAQFAELAHKIRQAVRRKQAEHTLRVNEERLEMAQRIGHTGSWGYILETNKIWASSEAYRIFGYPLATGDFPLEDIEACIPERERVHQALIDLITKEQEYNLEYTVNPADGSAPKIIHSVARLDKDVNGNPSRIIGVIHDITELKKTEEEKNRFGRILDSSLNELYIFDAETLRFLDANLGARKNLGYTLEELRMLTPLDLKPEFTLESFEKLIAPLRSSEKEELVFTTVHKRKDRSLYPIEIHLQLSRTGVSPVFVAIILDITEQKKENEALRGSEKRFRTFIETSPDMIWQIDPQGNFKYISPRVKTILGYDPEELIGKPVIILIPEHARSFVMQEIGKHAASRAGLFTLDVPAKHKNGRDLIIEIRSMPLTDSGGNVIELMGVAHDITDRRRTYTALKTSEELYRKLVATVPDLFVQTDLEGKITYINDQGLALSGYSSIHEITGTPVFQFFAPEDITRALTSTKLMFERQLGPVEYSFITRDGKRHTLEINGDVLRTPEGEPYGMVYVGRDVTEREKAKKALFESEKRFRGMAERSSEVIIILDKGMSVSYASPSSRSILGFDPEELVGKPPEFASSTIFSENDPKLMSAVQSTMKGLSVENVELQIKKKDGSTAWGEMYAVPVMHDGVFAGAQVSLRDITRQKTAETELREAYKQIAATEEELREQLEDLVLSEQRTRESEEKFRSIVETSPDMIWETDLRGAFRYMSPMVQTIMGYTPEEVIGKSIIDLVPEAGKSGSMQELMRMISTEGALSPIEIPARHRNGSDILLEIRPTRLTGTDGKLKGLRGVTVDITQRRRSEDALRRVNRQLSLLTGITRHDILNNLSVILGFLKITEKKFNDPALAEYLRKMESATKAIRSQIEFTRVYQDLGSHEPQWTDLDTVMPRSHIPAAITLNANVQGVLVFADPMLERVFFNLLDNSIRHGQRVTEIQVSSHQSDEVLVVMWEDNGIGISQNEKERIFERGFGKNTGLGMFLVREILSLTGITISETGEPGKGARFEILVPKGMWRVAGSGK